MMAAATLASSHNIASLDPIDKVTITTLKRYPKLEKSCARVGRLTNLRRLTLSRSESPATVGWETIATSVRKERRELF